MDMRSIVPSLLLLLLLVVSGALAQNAVEAHRAARSGDVEALRHIAATSPEDLVREDENGWQPIHEGANNGHLQVVKFLLEHGAKVNQRTFFNRGVSLINLVLDRYFQTKEDSDAKLLEFLFRAGGLNIYSGNCKGDSNGSLDVGPEASDRPWATHSHFEVAGVNLALYNTDNQEQAGKDVTEKPFELYNDFDISDLINGDETWADLMKYRQKLERPSLSFYGDKVAMKRWLPSIGIAQPHLYALYYASELPSDNIYETILSLLPTNNTNYVAKPSHTSCSQGVLLVGDDGNGNTVYSDSVKKLAPDNQFRPEKVANKLAESLHVLPYNMESWALFQVQPGFVVEERFSDLDCIECPPLEIKFFTIWGRVWVAEVVYDDERGGWCGGFVHRNGTSIAGTAGKFATIPDWVNWSHLVEVAEKLGAHKDMLRTDLFVGVPAGSNARTREERLAALQYVVSETAFHPTPKGNIFEPFHEIVEEGTRLWVAGYMMGNYRVVPNTEVPSEVFHSVGDPEHGKEMHEERGDEDPMDEEEVVDDGGEL